jgi:hypothetical protein
VLLCTFTAQHVSRRDKKSNKKQEAAHLGSEADSGCATTSYFWPRACGRLISWRTPQAPDARTTKILPVAQSTPHLPRDATSGCEFAFGVYRACFAVPRSHRPLYCSRLQSSLLGNSGQQEQPNFHQTHLMPLLRRVQACIARSNVTRTTPHPCFLDAPSRRSISAVTSLPKHEQIHVPCRSRGHITIE